MRIQLEHFRGNEAFVKRIYDQIDQMERQQRIIITPFFSPDQNILTETICGHATRYQKQGGYAGAERCRFAFLPYEEAISIPITMMKATYSSAFGELSHRDILGAVMNLGIARELIGDILVNEHSIYLFCDPEIENYLVCNLTKVKRTSVHFKKVDEEPIYEAKIHHEQRIVSSLRLDTIVASLAHVARGKAQTMITAGFVKVDHVVLEQTSYLCNNNSAISIRGYGRFQFSSVLKKTKKDHFVIEIGIYR